MKLLTTPNKLKESGIRMIACAALSLSVGCLIQIPAMATPNTISSHALSSNTTQQVLGLYTSRQYSAALPVVNQLLQTNPTSADLHYLKANILRATGNITTASDEYRRALELNPSPEVENYCLQVLSRSVGNNTQSIISFQATAQANNVLQTAGDAVATKNNDAENFANYEAKHAAEVEQAIMGSGVQRSAFVQAVNSQAAQQVAYDAAHQTGLMNEATQRSGQDTLDSAHNQVAVAAQTAENLQDLLATPALPGTPQLNPVGTNYFVRNYNDAQNPAPESAQKSAQTPALVPLVAKELSLPNPLKAAPATVHQVKRQAGRVRSSATVTTHVVGNMVKRPA